MSNPNLSDAVSVLVDSHSHFDADEFDHDREAVYQRAIDAGVKYQIVPAIHAQEWEKLRDVCASYPGLHPAYGLHPIYLDRHQSDHIKQLRNWLERHPAIAIGECGLDFYVDDLDRTQQQTYFIEQLKLARDFNLPVIVHARRAVDAVIAALRQIGGLTGVIHSWSGSEEQAKQLWAMGFYLGIGGPVTYERAQRLRRLVSTMPQESLLLETDSPDQPDSQIRGQRNQPDRLRYICEVVAHLRDTSTEEIARITTENATRLFKFSL